LRLGAGKNARKRRACSAKRGGGAGRRAGFTLVEVIVVLVILAILAAIAIPALTGYIDKAQDRKDIAWARDVMVAYKAALNEAYAEGKLTKADLENGYPMTKVKAFNVYGDYQGLLGWGSDEINEFLDVVPYAPLDSGANAASADAFIIGTENYEDYPNGFFGTTFVTYHLAPFDDSDDTEVWNIIFASSEPVYDAGEGYHVYHFDKDGKPY
jgi:prepilin-type N-terminal cleavage/methylation domain-containing protein